MLQSRVYAVAPGRELNLEVPLAVDGYVQVAVSLLEWSLRVELLDRGESRAAPDLDRGRGVGVAAGEHRWGLQVFDERNPRSRAAPRGVGAQDHIQEGSGLVDGQRGGWGAQGDGVLFCQNAAGGDCEMDDGAVTLVGNIQIGALSEGPAVATGAIPPASTAG